jgi:hypothetical protein
MTILECVDKYSFKNWKACYFNVTPYDIMATLNIENLISGKLYKPFTNVLIILEFIANMMNRCDFALEKHHELSKLDEYDVLAKNVNDLIERFGYTLYDIENEEKRIIIENNPAATAAAEISKKDIAVRIMQYNHYLLKGDISAKKDIILALAGDIEPQRPELKTIHSSVETNLFFLLNNLNLRHNNIEPEDKNYKEIVADMNQTELESWYDETYQLILLSKLLLDNNERNKKITALRAKMH